MANSIRDNQSFLRYDYRFFS